MLVDSVNTFYKINFIFFINAFSQRANGSQSQRYLMLHSVRPERAAIIINLLHLVNIFLNVFFVMVSC
jgi:hypothetical protein